MSSVVGTVTGYETPPSSSARNSVAEEDPTKPTQSTQSSPDRVLSQLVDGSGNPHTGSSTLRPTEYKKWEYVSRIDRNKGILQYITEKIDYLNYKDLRDEDLLKFLLEMPVETLLSVMFELKKKLNKAKETTNAAIKKKQTAEMDLEQAQDEQAEQAQDEQAEQAQDEQAEQAQAEKEFVDAQAQKELNDAKKKENSEYEALKKYITELKTTIQSVEGDIVPSLTNPRSRSRNLKRASRHGSRITRKHK